MKRTFLAKRNALLAGGRPSAGLVALVLVLLLAGVRVAAPNLFYTALSPIFGFSSLIGSRTHAALAGLTGGATLAAEADRLRAENTNLQIQIEALHRQVSSIGAIDNASESIVAGVLARPPTSPYDTLIVNAGSDAGVVERMTAYGADAAPIGVVTGVEPRFSRITLLSSPEMVTQGWLGSAHTPVQLIGLGGSAFSVSIPRTIVVREGDIIYLPGPGAIPVGQVIRIDDNAALPVIALRVQSIQNIFSITWVGIRDAGSVLQSAVATSTMLAP